MQQNHPMRNTAHAPVRCSAWVTPAAAISLACVLCLFDQNSSLQASCGSTSSMAGLLRFTPGEQLRFDLHMHSFVTDQHVDPTAPCHGSQCRTQNERESLPSPETIIVSDTWKPLMVSPSTEEVAIPFLSQQIAEIADKAVEGFLRALDRPPAA